MNFILCPSIIFCIFSLEQFRWSFINFVHRNTMFMLLSQIEYFYIITVSDRLLLVYRTPLTSSYWSSPCNSCRTLLFVLTECVWVYTCVYIFIFSIKTYIYKHLLPSYPSMPYFYYFLLLARHFSKMLAFINDSWSALSCYLLLRGDKTISF